MHPHLSKIISVGLLTASLLAATSSTANNCEKVIAGQDETQDIQILIVGFKDGFITEFQTLGHGARYPRYSIKSKAAGPNGTWNITYESVFDGQQNYPPKIATMTGYKYLPEQHRCHTKVFRVEGETHRNVYCYGTSK
jgi:hypothetical protein